MKSLWIGFAFFTVVGSAQAFTRLELPLSTATEAEPWAVEQLEDGSFAALSAPTSPLSAATEAEPWAVEQPEDGSFASLAPPTGWHAYPVPAAYERRRWQPEFPWGRLIDFDHDGDPFDRWNSDDKPVSAVPEPASWVLLGGGVAVLGAVLARKGNRRDRL